jgi:hypothetical protein
MSYSSDWKKVKPSSLKKEMLTQALKDLDTAIDKFSKSHAREDLAFLGGAAKSAVRAHAETVKLCDPKSQKKTVDWLSSFGKKLEFMSESVTKWQKEFATLMQESQKRRDTVVKALGTTASRPNAQLAAVGLKQANDYAVWLQKQLVDYKSPEIHRTVLLVVQAKNTFAEMVKLTDPKEVAKLNADARTKNEVRMQKLAAEMKVVAKDLSAPVKTMHLMLAGEQQILK